MTAADPTRPVPAGESTSMARWRRYVAVGDSFTEGLWDPTPGDEDRCRGWADRLAEILDERRGGDFEYANLAVRGRLLRPILTEQVPAALRSEPDLVSVIGGGNDVLRPGSDVDLLADRLESTVARIRETGADVLISTGMDAAESPVIKLTRSKTAIFNSHIWSIARRHDAYVLDLWGMRFLKDWRMWSEDRIHLTPEGHRRMAQGALEALGLVPDDPEWDTPLPPPDAEAWADRFRQNAQWVREHAYPWVQRRVRKQSSGDSRVAKQPVPGAVRRSQD
ncbi:lysophospholipase L1-like esterase [Flavimobilis soli]|uniref:Lysophospholipase L1-like esterase n=1 Tax=Flavimobilis soli TaxID=442709 RepID=A0A2A9EGL8_9MICO|nr:lysophospholipase L1-like esterase [Flavimobilis soli]